MQQRQLLGMLIRPSWYEGIVVAFLSILLVTLASWSALTHSPFLYDSFFGVSGIVSTLDKTSGAVITYIDSISALPWLYNIMIGLVAVIVGLSTFVILQAIFSGVSAFSHFMEDLHAGSEESRQTYEKEVEMKIAIRALAGILLIVVFITSITLLIPWAIRTSEAGAIYLPNLRGWLMILFAIFITFAVIHLQVVLLRLLFLRPRLFGLSESLMLQQN